MPSKVRPAQSRRSRLNVIAAPRETVVTNVGTFVISNRSYRWLKSFPYPLFRMAVFPQGFSLEKKADAAKSVHLYLTPPSRRFSCGFGEDLCEMALVGESASERYFNERGICREHEIFGDIDAPLHQPAMWRNSSATSKRSGKGADGKPALAGDLFQREFFFEVGVDRISRKPQLPRRQPS